MTTKQVDLINRLVELKVEYLMNEIFTYLGKRERWEIGNDIDEVFKQLIEP